MTDHDEEARRLITEAFSSTDTIAAATHRCETARATLHRAARHAAHGQRVACSETLAAYATIATATETAALYDLCFAGACMIADLAPEGQELDHDDPHGEVDVLWRVGINLVNLAIGDAWTLFIDQLDTAHREGGDDVLRGVVASLMGIYRRLYPL